jgi:hypothetical protein
MTVFSYAIRETSGSAHAVLEAAQTLTAEAGTLQQAVDSFLEQVAAARSRFALCRSGLQSRSTTVSSEEWT